MEVWQEKMPDLLFLMESQRMERLDLVFKKFS